MIHQDCYDKYFTVKYFKDYIELEINFIPKNNNYIKGKIFFDIIPYFQIPNTVIKYNNKIFHNENELKKFFRMY